MSLPPQFAASATDVPTDDVLPFLEFRPLDTAGAGPVDLDRVQIAPDYAFTSWELTFAGPSDAPCYWLEYTLMVGEQAFPVAVEFCQHD